MANDTLSDETIYDNLKSFIESLVTILDSVPDMNTMESRFGTHVATKQEEEIGSRRAAQIADELQNNWENFPQFEECEGAFKSSDIFDKEVGYALNQGVVEDMSEKEELIKTDTLPKFLKRYLTKKGDLEFDADVFDETYEEFEEYLAADEVEYQAAAVIQRLELQNSDKVIELEDDLRIKCDDSDKFGTSSLSEFTDYAEQDSGTVTVVEKVYTVDKFGEDNKEQAIKSFMDVVLALRLFGSHGDIFLKDGYTKPISPFHVGVNRFNFQSDTVPFLDENYVISDDLEEEFIEFWTDMNENIEDPPESYRVAIEKFSNSFNRENLNDRLLDSVIALEAIYLKSSENQEMSYRLSQRGALLLANDKSEALDIQSTLSDSYNKRSRLVHGSAPNLNQKTVVELLDLTRESLKVFLQENRGNKSHKKILEELDEEAVTPVN